MQSPLLHEVMGDIAEMRLTLQARLQREERDTANVGA
jgi:hypothetical protein